ncbi:MAG: MCE family protein [Chloroflexi bacterium]|nr:MCE family protein [Chloroflexota bacterium]
MRRSTLAGLVLGTLVISGCGIVGGGGTYSLSAYFPRAVAVYDSADVKILGLPAGEVTKVTVEDTRVRIDMRIDDDIPIPANVQAAIVPSSLIGERYIQLTPAWTEGDPRIEEGAVIPEDRVIVPVEPDEALGALKEFLDALDPEGLGRLIGNTADALEGNGATLNSALDNVSTLVSTFADKDAELVGLVENFDRFTATLVTREAQIGQVLDAFAAASQVLADEREKLEALVSALAGLSANTLSLVVEHSDDLRDDIEIATRLVRSVDANLASVGQLLDAGPLLVTGLENAYNEEFRAIDLRNDFGPLLNQFLAPLLDALLPGQDLCTLVPVLCALPLASGPATPASLGQPVTPIDPLLTLLGSPATEAADRGSRSVPERVVDGVAGVGGFLRDAAGSLLGGAG